LALSACGETTSNSVTLVAKNSDASLLSKLQPAVSTSTTTSFKICVKKVSLEDDLGEDHGNGSSSDDSNEIEFSLGEVDLSTIATSAITLGTIPNAPVGFKLNKVKIKLKKFGSCAHSIEYGTQTTDEDVEFRWTLSPAVTLSAGDTLDLYFSDLVQAISSAQDIDTAGFRTTIATTSASARRR